MKHLSILLFLFISVNLFAQTPGAFSYQAVVRNASGDVVANQEVAFQISILQDSETGAVVFTERHYTTTNDYGLANLQIGNGTLVSGSFIPEGWGEAPHFIKVEFDPDGGSSFTELSTTQLLAVPYAFHAQTVENDEVNDADADPTNEIQTLSLSGNDLTISDGNSVTLPAGGTSLWSEDGDDIYFENNVGIGTSDPGQDLDIINGTSSVRIKSTTPGTGTFFDFDGDAFLILDKASTSNNANLNFQSEGNGQFYAGLLGNNNFSISTNLASLNGLKVQLDGNVAISGELQTEATGSANMVPIAYGWVDSDGSIMESSGNVSCSRVSEGRYEITIDGENYHYSNYVEALTIKGDIGFIQAGSVNNNLLVRTYDENANLTDFRFSFVVYKP